MEAEGKQALTDWEVIQARFEKIERKLVAMQAEIDLTKHAALRADQRGEAHQPFIDRMRAREVGEAMTRRTPTPTPTHAQELADAVLAIRQLSSALEDLVRRGTK